MGRKVEEMELCGQWALLAEPCGNLCQVNYCTEQWGAVPGLG